VLTVPLSEVEGAEPKEGVVHTAGSKVKN